MKSRKQQTVYIASNILVFLFLTIIFIVPFVYIILMAAKSSKEAALLRFSLPAQNLFFQNLKEVVAYGDYRMFRALLNSTLLTVGSVALIVVFSALFAFVAQRKNDKSASILMSLLIVGLMIPPAVVPTIFLLQNLKIYKTMFGMIMIDVALFMPFATMIFRTAMSSIPRDLDEASYLDGASPLTIFFQVILPLLKPAIVTVVVTTSVNIFNDFVGPLYFLPGAKNITAPLTLYSFMSQFSTQWNLLFANVVVVSVIPLIIFIFFQRQLVAGMMGGAVKG
ncbi:carbohydrate ABC transporter permease [uncultured Sphaerochaeta sp.]|uniref:carbohydrate ABC transporter permease n=1 Tax=uncultured Sphaerochaeta sp. TaxID=886478 RepID=UPI0029CA6DA0|nr:carbohydrate ABC transporter permease [uncultured Sphaerochaeta sp.]MCK9349508.1 carbohydrate ABC transporter permease [Sphaerochaeta sp.]